MSTLNEWRYREETGGEGPRGDHLACAAQYSASSEIGSEASFRGQGMSFEDIFVVHAVKNA